MPLINPGFSHDSPVQVGFLVPALNVAHDARNIYIDTAIVSGVTKVTYVEGGPYSDAVTFTSITTIDPASELEFVHPTGQWGPFDDDNGQL